MFGLALVICYPRNTVWIHKAGDNQEVAICNVEPYELWERDEDAVTDNGGWNLVQVEDSLQDVFKDFMETRYLDFGNIELLDKSSILTVVLPVSDYGRPEVNVANDNKISN